MIENRIPVHFSDRRRRNIDRLVRRAVTACGVGVLLVMLLLFFWLIVVVVPLFAPASLKPGQTIELTDPQPTLALGLQDKWAWRIDARGVARFIGLNGQPTQPALQLSQPPERVVSSADNQTLALIQPQHRFMLLQPAAIVADIAWRFPLGDTPLALPAQNIDTAALAQRADNRWRLAVADAQQISVAELQADRPPVWQTLSSGATSLAISPDGHQLYAALGRQLQLWSLRGEQPALQQTLSLPLPVKGLRLLSGGRSLLVIDDNGISQWFSVMQAQGAQLTRSREFAEADGRGQVIAEVHRRAFATLSAEGKLQFFASKQAGPIFTHQFAAGTNHIAISPQGNQLLTERAGQLQTWQLDNPWPDVSWRSLWQKVWYENYPAPDWVWQSTAANDDYQAKFSLVPMVSGTLKAALLALLFATPLALAAAMYTAWFMSPALRRWVKPAIEMMGALPSVVIGLIAGLWLAPKVADHLLAVLLLPFILAAAILLFGWACNKLTGRWRQPAGREVALLLPWLLLITLLTLWLLPAVEQQLLGDSLAGRLQHSYQQRNLLIAGVAMGFALVPLIFTLAEDALFSVPAALGQGSLALGATPWQTLTRIVLPGASAGIFAALMIGFGRAVGETMIVLMATGNTPQTSGGLFNGARALSANIAIEMPEAAAGSAHYRILFLSALVLLAFTLVVNTLAEMVRQRLRRRYGQHEGQG